MVLKVVDNEIKRGLLLTKLASHKLPFTVEIVAGKHRSTEQNRLQRLWCKEIAQHFGDRTAEEVRGDCKLRFGVPILRSENEMFREKYDRLIKPLPYETKLEYMMEPLDFPVTRLMKTEQKTAYLDAVQRHYLAEGVRLTQPKDKNEPPPANFNDNERAA